MRYKHRDDMSFHFFSIKKLGNQKATQSFFIHFLQCFTCGFLCSFFFAFAAAAAKAVASGECDKGIVLCTTGIGVSITANKVKGIRCALLSDVMSARMTREHNDTNMMAIGAGVVGQMLAFEIVDTWLGTEFSNEARHQRRIDKMMELEK